MRPDNLGASLNNKKIIILCDSIEQFNSEDTKEFLDTLNVIEDQIRDCNVGVSSVFVKNDVEKALRKFDPNEVVIFNWCEALNFVDKDMYKIPEELDRLGFIYTGSNSEALQLTQSKVLTKQILIKNKIPVPAYKTYKRGGEFLKNWNIFPAIIKPGDEHCSNGITRDSVVDNVDQLADRVDFIFKNFGGSAVIEEFIGGSEFMVGLWGADNYEVLPIVQLDYSAIKDYHDSIYSFDAKWNAETEVFKNIKQICPAEISKELEEKIKATAIDAFVKTGCSNYGRLELRVKDNVPYVLDINPNSDMMGPNEFILSAKKLGYNHGDIFVKLCELALISQVPATVSTAETTAASF